MPEIQISEVGPFNYSRMFGLAVRSALPLPACITTCADSTFDSDVDVVYDFVPDDLQDAASSGVRYQARPGRLLLKVDDVGRYMICDGRRIIIDRNPQAQDDDVRLFLIGSAFGALLHQRGVLVLHGSAVVIQGVGVAFVGPSGIGKSTLVTALSRLGLAVLTDDLCVITPDETSGLMQVCPGIPESKLWMDSLQRLGIGADGLRRVRNRLEKRALPLGASFAHHPVPLKHIYVLRSTHTTQVSLTRLQGPQKFNALRNQTYRLHFLQGLGARPAHFRNALLLANQAQVSAIARPRGEFLLDELVHDILTDLKA